MRTPLKAAIVALGMAVTSAALPVLPAHAFTIYFVTNVTDAGAGTLRQAIIDANASAGGDAIFFAIAGAGPHVIVPLTNLPVVTDPVIIAGYTEPSASQATAVAPAVLSVVIDGANMTDGLVIQTSFTSVAGLNIYGLPGIGGQCGGVGICVTGNNNLIRGNYVGVDTAGLAAVPNSSHGVSVTGNFNTVGGTAPEHRNIISGNNNDGVRLDGHDNKVLGNWIGVDANGTAPLGNTGTGVSVTGGANQIGSPDGGGNVISASTFDGIEIDNSAPGCVVKANLIGTNAAGTAAMGNRVGISIASDDNQIGGTAVGAGNVISGNTAQGVVIDSLAADNQVEGNIVGLGSTLGALGNGDHGVWVTSGNANRVTANTVGTNGGDGIFVDSSDSRVTGNLVGLAISGGAVVARGNTGSGVTVTADAVQVKDNVIGFNGGHGVNLGGASDDTVVVGNGIGVFQNGTANLANAQAGVFADGDTNVIGSADPAVPANTIAHNAGGGVVVGASGDDNAILRNSIFGNTGLGIDLDATGVTANDVLDADSGSNDVQNFPVITSAVTAAGVTTIGWSVATELGVSVRIEFFSSPNCDSSGNGEGRTFLGDTLAVTSAATGLAGGNTVTAVAAPVGQNVTAAVTMSPAAGVYTSTSEFSACVVVT